MIRYHIVLWAVFLYLADHAVTQSSTRCSLLLRNGGWCVSLREPCPEGMFEYEMLSNYVGCFRPDQKCCAGSPQGIVKNPGGIDPTPPRTCGGGSFETSSRILDGVYTSPCDWPFVVSIRAPLFSSGGLTYEETSHVCQGVLIDQKWVLTSPWCLLSAGNTVQEAPSRILVVAGEYNVSGIDIDPLTGAQQEQEIRVSNVYIHPDHQISSLEQAQPLNDSMTINSNAVALIKLVEPIRGRCSGTVCLPTESEAANDCAAYENCIITGWGFSKENFDGGPSDELLLGKVQLSSNLACDFLTERLGLAAWRPAGTMCKRSVDRDIDACLSLQGDEGGAVMCSRDHSWVVRAILPFNLCMNNHTNLYVTSVAHFLDWIQATMRSS